MCKQYYKVQDEELPVFEWAVEKPKSEKNEEQPSITQQTCNLDDNGICELCGS